MKKTNKSFGVLAGNVTSASIFQGKLKIVYEYDVGGWAGEFIAPLTASPLKGTWTDKSTTSTDIWTGPAELRFVSQDGHCKFFGEWDGYNQTNPKDPKYDGEWAGEFDLPT
jgi:hypothetical protein